MWSLWCFDHQFQTRVRNCYSVPKLCGYRQYWMWSGKSYTRTQLVMHEFQTLLCVRGTVWKIDDDFQDISSFWTLLYLHQKELDLCRHVKVVLQLSHRSKMQLNRVHTQYLVIMTQGQLLHDVDACCRAAPSAHRSWCSWILSNSHYHVFTI